MGGMTMVYIDVYKKKIPLEPKDGGLTYHVEHTTSSTTIFPKANDVNNTELWLRHDVPYPTPPSQGTPLLKSCPLGIYWESIGNRLGVY